MANKPSKMKDSTQRILVISALILIGIIGATLATNWPYFEINKDLSKNAYDILLKYIFIIIVFERSIAVYNALRFENRKIAARRRIKNFEKKKALFEKLEPAEKKKYTDNDRTYQELLKDRSTDAPDVHYINLIELEEKNLEQLSEKTRKFSMRALMVLGVLFAIGGLSIFNDLLEFSKEWYKDASRFQQIMMRFLDIIITGALIGGGSKSFHALLTTIQSVLDQVKQGRSSEQN